MGMAGEAQPERRSIWQGREDESKDREIWTGWATLGFADGARRAGMSKRQMSPLLHSPALRSSSLRQTDSGWMSCSVPQAGGRVLCQQNLQVILRNCRAAGGAGGGEHLIRFCFHIELPARFQCSLNHRLTFSITLTDAPTFCSHPEGSLSCSHKHLERMHLVGSMKRMLDRFHCFNEASCKPLKIRKFHI